MGTTIDSAQEQEVAFLSGVSAQGTVAGQSFWTWNDDAPATYDTSSLEAKWGPASAGTGATISYSFDPAAGWSPAEMSAFQAAMGLWSDVANVHFTQVDNASGADLVLLRAHNRKAETGSSIAHYAGDIGSADLGTFRHARVSIDTSVKGFGPLGASLGTLGGYPWQTVVHEIGHVLGLGHAGAYDDNETAGASMLTSYDNTGWSIMSYYEGSDPDLAGQTAGDFRWGYAADGSLDVAVTPMPLDIIAAQRLYGAPVDTPLSGGQVFGFNSNIQGATAAFFDFSVNTKPVVTLFDTGGGNTLDLSGYSTPNQVSLADGTYSSVGGLTNDVAIARGTLIDTAIGGTSSDTIHGNNDGDYLMGNSGDDTINGGDGNDHIYGNMASSPQGATDGNDRIDTGGGTNYVNGNAGDDDITAHGDANRIYGGAGNDSITIDNAGVNAVNGNAGDDHIYVSGGNNVIRGGQGDDSLYLFIGNNVAFGDLGNDYLDAGSGVNVLTGGGGADTFFFTQNASPLDRGGALAGYHDEITDFTRGVDKIHIVATSSSSPVVVVHPQDGAVYASADDAAQALQYTMQGSFTNFQVVSAQVGSDTYLLYDASGFNQHIDSAIKLDGIGASQIDPGDFTT